MEGPENGRFKRSKVDLKRTVGEVRWFKNQKGNRSKIQNWTIFDDESGR